MQPMKFVKSIMKSFASKPATAMYPIVKKDFYSNTRGKIDITIEDCVYCGICSKKCPTGAIKVVRPEKVWEIDRLRCIVCNYCVESCPKKCLAMGNHYSSPATLKEKEVFKDARIPDNATDS